MKTNYFIVISVILLSSFLSSCAKCYTCKNSVEKRKVCSKDPDDKDDVYDNVEYYESNGYKCSVTNEAI